MNNATTYRARLTLSAAFLLILMGISSASAATHTITFGSNFQYTPSQLNVAVGDVITWQGNFSMHPLQFDQVPTGATLPANVTSGSSFSYTVEVAGAYAYHCMLHGSAAGAGMAGTFTALTASVDQPIDLKMLSLWPNPATNTQTVQIDLGFEASRIQKIYIIEYDGRYMTYDYPSHVANTSHQIEIDLAPFALPPGAYLLRIEADGTTYNRKLMITR